jgi:predicted RNA-binding Zn-ribbon protein involved in translation (DUF1610 family)
MNKRTYYGDITPADMAAALVGAFTTANLRCHQVTRGDKIIVQIATRENARSGGKAAMTVTLFAVEDGVSVAIGQLEWLGVAASLGKTALTTLRNPWSIIGRLDDLAQDINSLRLEERAWEVLENYARTRQATKTLSANLLTLSCLYCHSANKVGIANCVSCGAPLGEIQPIACPRCGNVMAAKSTQCSNCGMLLQSASVSPRGH